VGAVIYATSVVGVSFVVPLNLNFSVVLAFLVAGSVLAVDYFVRSNNRGVAYAFAVLVAFAATSGLLAQIFKWLYSLLTRGS
jgi:hypothetical protein